MPRNYENKYTGFTLITDEAAKALANECPPHKIVIDCGWEVPVAAQAVAGGAESIVRLAAPYTDLINNTPELKTLASGYSLRAHEIVKELFALAQEFGDMAAKLGLAIAEADYKYPKK